MGRKKRYIIQKMVVAGSSYDALRRESEGEIYSVYVYGPDEKEVGLPEEKRAPTGFRSGLKRKI